MLQKYIIITFQKANLQSLIFLLKKTSAQDMKLQNTY